MKLPNFASTVFWYVRVRSVRIKVALFGELNNTCNNVLSFSGMDMCKLVRNLKLSIIVTRTGRGTWFLCLHENVEVINSFAFHRINSWVVIRRCSECCCMGRYIMRNKSPVGNGREIYHRTFMRWDSDVSNYTSVSSDLYLLSRLSLLVAFKV